MNNKINQRGRKENQCNNIGGFLCERIKNKDKTPDSINYT